MGIPVKPKYLWAHPEWQDAADRSETWWMNSGNSKGRCLDSDWDQSITSVRDEAILKGSSVPQGLVGEKGKRKQKAKDNSPSDTTATPRFRRKHNSLITIWTLLVKEILYQSIEKGSLGP